LWDNVTNRPPEWRFKFLGTEESVAFLNKSIPIRGQVKDGKLDIGVLPAGFRLDGQEATSATFTNLTFYRDVLAPAENLLVFQTDSMLCANSLDDLNFWAEFDWVGAAWYDLNSTSFYTYLTSLSVATLKL